VDDAVGVFALDPDRDTQDRKRHNINSADLNIGGSVNVEMGNVVYVGSESAAVLVAKVAGTTAKRVDLGVDGLYLQNAADDDVDAAYVKLVYDGTSNYLIGGKISETYNRVTVGPNKINYGDGTYRPVPVVHPGGTMMRENHQEPAAIITSAMLDLELGHRIRISNTGGNTFLDMAIEPVSGNPANDDSEKNCPFIIFEIYNDDGDPHAVTFDADYIMGDTIAGWPVAIVSNVMTITAGQRVTITFSIRNSDGKAVMTSYPVGI
jgi:hypothetical protein